MELVGYGILLFYSNQSAKTTLVKVRNEQIQAIITSNFYRINNLTELLEHKALDLAKAGELLYDLRKQQAAAQMESAFKNYLVDSIEQLPAAIGGGVWFEPKVFDPEKIYFGPYAFINSQNTVEFTWDLNTPTYDYHNQSWYLRGLPADWPRNQRRPQSIYWSDPYYDEAGSKALMMTVDAVMYSPDDHVIGLASVDWSLQEMTHFVQQIKITENSKVFLVDSRSDLILSNTLQTDSVMQKRQSVAWLNVIDANVQEAIDISHAATATVDGIAYRIYYAKSEIGLILGVVIPQGEIYQEIEAVAKAQAFNGVVIIVFFILAMLFLLYVLFKPFQKVQNLIAGSIAMSDGNKLQIKPVEYAESNEFTPIVSAINLAYEQINVYTEKVEEANKSKTNFLSTMSHEIRTPMNAILGYAQLLNLEQNVAVEHKLALQAIDSSGKHLLDLLNDILDISKIESGEHVIHPENIYLADLLLAVEHIFKLRCLQKGVEWHSEFAVDPALVVYADGAKISQILINLIGNAVKFTHKGKISFLVSLQENSLRIEVADTGEGISTEFQHSMFTPFAQDAAGRQKGGTGLGLAIVAKIVHLMYGAITFSSKLHEGTTFIVTLPLPLQNNNYPAARRQGGRALGDFTDRGLSALVLDDVRVNCDILSKILEKMGVASAQANNGEDALLLLETMQPDILFIDIQMPVMDGFEFLEQIKIKYPQLVSRSIAISANVYKNPREYTSQGFDRYITKPFLLKEISAAIETVVGKAAAA